MKGRILFFRQFSFTCKRSFVLALLLCTCSQTFANDQVQGLTPLSSKPSPGIETPFLPLPQRPTPVSNPLEVTIVRASGRDPKLPGLKFSDTKYEVNLNSNLKEPVSGKLKLEGRFRASDGTYKRWSLADFSHVGSLPVLEQSKKGEFKYEIELKAPVTLIEFAAISPMGAIEREEIGFYWSGYETLEYERMYGKEPQEEPKPAPMAPWTGEIATSFLTLDYKETGVPDISQTQAVVSGKISHGILSSAFRLQTNTLISIFTFSHPTSDFLNLFDLGGLVYYQLPFEKFLPPELRFEIGAGIFYSTTHGGSRSFGYSNLVGPSFSLLSEWRLKNDGILKGELGLATLTAPINAQVYGLGNLKSNLGLGYQFSAIKAEDGAGWFRSHLRGTRPGLKFEISHLSLLPQSSKNLSVSYQTLMLGVDLSF